MKDTSKVSGSGPNQTGLKTNIPKVVREKLGLKKGDILIWEETNSEVKIRKLT